MPKKNTYKGSRKVDKKVSKKSSKKSSKKMSKNSSKRSKRSSKPRSNKRKSHKNITTSSDDMREILEMDNKNPVTPQQMNGMPMQGMPMQGMPMQGMQQPQMLSPSQIDPMMVNHTVPYQQNHNIMGMNPNNMMSSQQMVQGLSNFANAPNEISKDFLSSNVSSTPNFAGLNQNVGLTPPGAMNQMPTMNPAGPMNQMPMLSPTGGMNPTGASQPNLSGIMNFIQ